MSSTHRTLALTVLLAHAALAAPSAAAPTPADVRALKGLSIEELMQLDVTSVARHAQPFGSVPAALSVVTADDIRRSGVTSLAEAMRLAAGVEVARFDSRTWAVTARGFATNVSNKMLVLIDGRSVYTPLFGGVFWEVQDTPLEDVDRIEVIRGPGATLWGSNAVNGVIQITTRNARDTQSSLVTAGAGNEERSFATVRHGGTLGANGAWRAYGSWHDRDGLVLASGADARDDYQKMQGGFRADWALPGDDALTVAGDLYRGDIGNLELARTDVAGGNVLARWRHTLAGGSEVTVQSYYDRTYRDVPDQFEEWRETGDFEVQHHVELGRHDVVWGGGYRASADRTVDSPVFQWRPRERTIGITNLFVQDEIALADRWRFTAGTKLEEIDSSGLEVQPTLRLSFAPAPSQLLWAAVSRAVRAPTRIDEDSRFTTRNGILVLTGDPDFQPEEVVTAELGFRRHAGPASAELVVYHNDYDELRSQEPPASGPIPVHIGNGLRARTWGGTLQGNLELGDRTRLQASWSHLEKRFSLAPGSHDVSGGVAEGNDPSDFGFLRASLDLPHATELDVWLRGVDSLPNPHVPGYVELDLRLGWRLRADLELALVGQNLLRASHPEFGPDTLRREEVQRSLYARVTWRP